jgi:hypothetical protein
MATYIRAGLPEVATSLAALTSEDHRWRSSRLPEACRFRAHLNDADMSSTTETCYFSHTPWPLINLDPRPANGINPSETPRD